MVEVSVKLAVWLVVLTWDAADVRGETHVCVAAETAAVAERHGMKAIRATMRDGVAEVHVEVTTGCPFPAQR